MVEEGTEATGALSKVRKGWRMWMTREHLSESDFKRAWRVDPWEITGLMWPAGHKFNDHPKEQPAVHGCAAPPKPVCTKETCLQMSDRFRASIGKAVWHCATCCVTQFPGVYDDHLDA